MTVGADEAGPALVLGSVPPNGQSSISPSESTPSRSRSARRPGFPERALGNIQAKRLATSKGVPFMAYEPHAHEPAPVDPDRGSLAGYAAIKYTAIVIVVLAIIAFLAWVIILFT